MDACFVCIFTAGESVQAKNRIKQKIGIAVARHVKSFLSEKQLEGISFVASPQAHFAATLLT